MTGAAMPNSVGAVLSNAARRFGDKTALVYDEQRWSFRQLDEASSRVS